MKYDWVVSNLRYTYASLSKNTSKAICMQIAFGGILLWFGSGQFYLYLSELLQWHSHKLKIVPFPGTNLEWYE